MFKALSDEKINILAISSEIKISVIIDEGFTVKAVKKFIIYLIN